MSVEERNKLRLRIMELQRKIYGVPLHECYFWCDKCGGDMIERPEVSLDGLSYTRVFCAKCEKDSKR